MVDIITPRGTFSIIINSRLTPPADAGEEGAAVQYGADFTISFQPKARTGGKFGLVQLIRPQTDVGPYRANKSAGGWAVDKQQSAASGASNNAHKLMFGITGDNVRPELTSRFGGNGAPTIMKDKPTEILPTESERLGLPTKFVHYVVDCESNSIYDEGVLWSYQAVERETEVSPPRTVSLKEQNEHKDAMAHFLSSTREVIARMII
ncbi:MAG: hypothetical protein ACJ8AW_38890 [Rhodopila sp.]